MASLLGELNACAAPDAASAAGATPGRVKHYMIFWSHNDLFAPIISSAKVMFTPCYSLVKRFEIGGNPPANVARNFKFDTADVATAITQDRVVQNYQLLHGQRVLMSLSCITVCLLMHQ